MIGLLEFKKALGPTAEELSEKEILELRDNQDQMAEIFFAMWKSEIKSSENKV